MKIVLVQSSCGDGFFVPANDDISFFLFDHLCGKNRDPRGIQKHALNGFKILAKAHGWTIEVKK